MKTSYSAVPHTTAAAAVATIETPSETSSHIDYEFLVIGKLFHSPIL
jgi:hypothetical protein